MLQVPPNTPLHWCCSPEKALLRLGTPRAAVFERDVASSPDLPRTTDGVATTYLQTPALQVKQLLLCVPRVLASQPASIYRCDCSCACTRASRTPPIASASRRHKCMLHSWIFAHFHHSVYSETRNINSTHCTFKWR